MPMEWKLCLNEHFGSLYEKFNKQFVLESERPILENNNCKFNDEIFVQINGIAIWAIFAPTYEMLSMDYFELNLYRICINGFGEKLGQLILQKWCLYLMTVKYT